MMRVASVSFTSLGVEALFVERPTGTFELRRGFTLEPGEKVLMVEDVVTTGASTLRAIERATASGLRVAAVVALVDRLEGGRDAVVAHAPLYPLFTRKDFLP